MAEDTLSLLLAGEAGQGIQTVENLLTPILKESGYYVFATKEYMSRIRGGTNTTQVRIGSKPVSCPVDVSDIIVLLDDNSLNHVRERIGRNTLVVGSSKALDGIEAGVEVGFEDAAKELGDSIYSNTVATGLLCGLVGADTKAAKQKILERFAKKGREVAEDNIGAYEKGLELAASVKSASGFECDVEKDESAKDMLLIKGADAVGLGALAGGCNYITSYPMSPSTGVLVFLSQNASEFDIMAEQAEDEISAINMALGAWYAGARALVTTSGGGFALMQEGVSLSGMTETPVVVHVAQRPGPATGLPTRTGQEDLQFVQYAGHGEFPRAIFTPGTIEDAFSLSAHAFNIADKHQVPAFILTDQYIMDSYYSIKGLDLESIDAQQYIVESEADHFRYALNGSGVSPRAIPGFGRGVVYADSDEHTEKGLITESMDVRKKMVKKRLGKRTGLLEDSLEPEFIGGDEFKNLFICWGSVFGPLMEALDAIGDEKNALAYVKQPVPLNHKLGRYIDDAERVFVVEGNATGQLTNIIQLELGFNGCERISRFDGLQFTKDGLKGDILESLEVKR